MQSSPGSPLLLVHHSGRLKLYLDALSQDRHTQIYFVLQNWSEALLDVLDPVCLDAHHNLDTNTQYITLKYNIVKVIGIHLCPAGVKGSML